jgi:hypothetical protein
MSIAQGLKPQVFNAANGTAPLPPRAENRARRGPHSQPSLAELAQAKSTSRALTLVSSWTLLPQRLKPVLIAAGSAGLKACSTPWGTVHWNGESENPCSTLWGKDFPGLKPQACGQLYAALKGRSSTVQLCAANSFRSPLPEGKGWVRFSTVQSATMGVC